jgi:hypothetical protein
MKPINVMSDPEALHTILAICATRMSTGNAEFPAPTVFSEITNLVMQHMVTNE